MIDRSTLRIALRTLARHKGFTVVATLSIAVAVALNTTMYSALDKLVDPAINARDPERVYYFRFFGDLRRQLHPTAIEEAFFPVPRHPSDGWTCLLRAGRGDSNDRDQRPARGKTVR
jgi:hypothetical protein